ncbi:aldehyde dehydrogenase family protein [Solirubrobacter phytolaccae]|uniref:Aldehyde dehydrogenase family protein n=1 Tax=Solirubrobacter phytolaccae TaxID=1404360 RepID=A0A9X3NF29_9ACTN|nr:aldehyde dehydrogenase family protein [Solirubrobacter phytolaccae]MDA0184164.1 aldehyde dehydrogenase family protein [Solirubrobacter phytolaccae]
MKWDYAPAPESRDSATIKPRYDLFIGGRFVAPTDGTVVSTVNPATEEVLAEVAFAGPGDVALAVEAARGAAAGWAALPALERGKYLFRIARLLQERARELAIVETLDGGKPIRESRDVDVPLAAAHFFSYAGWADKLQYAFAGREFAPRGVVGQVVPWNFPLLMAAWKLAPALATGNTAVLKPAETTPLTALLLAEIIEEAGLPDGVVNIIPGDGSAGASLVRSDVDKVAFTGSTAVGKEIQRALAGTGKGLTLELGGKSANIVFEDAALDQAVEGIIEGIFFNQGHVCCAGSRLLLQESVAEEVVRKLWARMERLRVGDPLDKNTDVGAINSAEQLARITSMVEAGEREGATRRSVSCALPEAGYWFAPTMFLDVAPANRIAVEEIFGPVVSVTTFRSPGEAVEKANNSAYGLAAGVWTDNGAKAFEVASKLRAGVVWQNTYNKFDPTAAFGGYKESGFGREGGPAGLSPYVRFGG